MFRKLKIQITIIMLIILAIIGFFVVGKILEVKSLSQESEVNTAVIENLQDIKNQLIIQNCISVAQTQEEKESCIK